MSLVLVVEDEATIAEMLREVLADEGYRVVIAHDGQEGLERLAAERADLVLSDIMMPRLDGAGLGRRMQDDPAYRDIPLVFMSAASKALVTGCRYAAFLAKPFNLDDVVETVARVLARDAP